MADEISVGLSVGVFMIQNNLQGVGTIDVARLSIKSAWAILIQEQIDTKIQAQRTGEGSVQVLTFDKVPPYPCKVNWWSKTIFFLMGPELAGAFRDCYSTRSVQIQHGLATLFHRIRDCTYSSPD